MKVVTLPPAHVMSEKSMPLHSIVLCPKVFLEKSVPCNSRVALPSLEKGTKATLQLRISRFLAQKAIVRHLDSFRTAPS